MNHKPIEQVRPSQFSRSEVLKLAMGGVLALGGSASRARDLATKPGQRPTVSITATEVDPSAPTAHVNVQLSGPVLNTVVVSVATRNGTDLIPDRRAISGINYRPVNTFVVFRPGDSPVKSVPISLLGGKAGQWFELIVPVEIQGASGTSTAGRIQFKPGARNQPAPSQSRSLKAPTRGVLTFDLDLTSLQATDSGFVGRRPCLRSRFSHGRVQAGNHEVGYYTDPKLNPGTQPFDLKDGILTLRAERLKAPIRVGSIAYEYGSSVLTTETLFSQMYGYFEWEARLPSAPGTWPGLWLLPARGGWPPEIDVMEAPRNGAYRKGDTNAGAHWMEGAKHESVSARLSIDKLLGRPVDLVADFHRHAVEWRKDFTTWFVNDVEIFQAPTRFHAPAYALMDVALGGWAGKPDLSAGSAEMQIRRMRVWR